MNSIYEMPGKSVIDLSHIESISESKSYWGQPGHTSDTNSAGTYFGFEVILKYNSIPVLTYLCYDTDQNKSKINSWRQDLINKWKEFKGEI